MHKRSMHVLHGPWFTYMYYTQLIRFPNYRFRIFKAFVSVCYQMYLFVAEEEHHFRVLGETLCGASIVSLLRGSYRQGNLNDRTYDVLQS